MAEDQNQGPPTGVVNLHQARKHRQDRDQDKSKEQLLRDRYDKIMSRMNRDYAVALDHGTTWIFKEVENELRPGFRNVYRLTAPHFRLLHQNKRTGLIVPAPTTRNPDATKLVTRSYADWWLEWPQRRTYHDVVFAPGVTLKPDTYNLWPGWAVEPRKPHASGGWDLMQRHMLDVLCSGNTIWYDYLLRWMARLVQYPGEPGQVAVVLRGGEGYGKGIFGQYLLRIFGPCGLHLTNSAHLQSRYNAHLQNCIFLFADEAFWPGDKAFEGILRGYLTEPDLAVEAKYMNLYSTLNCLHALIVSNNLWVTHMAPGARRFFALQVLDLHRGDKPYFDALVRELNGGGPAAMLWDLQHLDIRHFDVRQIPDTPEGRRQKRLSLDTIKEYWITVLERGYPFHGKHGIRSLLQWREFYTTELLWNGYLEWCRDTNRLVRQTHSELTNFLAAVYAHGQLYVPQPVFEIDAPLPGHRHAELDPAQPDLPIGFDERLIDDEEPSTPGRDPFRLHDDPNGIVVLLRNKHGYKVGSLDEARARFEEVFEGIDTGWRQPIP
jgi:hypothetical protein